MKKNLMFLLVLLFGLALAGCATKEGEHSQEFSRTRFMSEIVREHQELSQQSVYLM